MEYYEEDEKGTGTGKGGGGGMDMFSAITNLGDRIHNNMLGQVSYFRDSRDKKQRDQMTDAEDKRRFNVSAAQSERQLDMSGIGMLAEQRGTADKNARLRSFRQALLKG